MRRFLQRLRSHTDNRQREHGFTFVEIVVVAPIVILSITAFIAVAIQLTGEVLISREQDTMVYSIQDAMNRMEQDVKLSSKFLATNSTPITAATRQGYNNTGATSSSDATPFYNATPPSNANGQMLVLKMLATSDNPLTDTAQFIYLSNSPNACGATQTDNTPLFYNVVYFVKDNSLWRRVIMPVSGTYTACPTVGGSGAAVPYQRASCRVGYTDTAACKTEDEMLVRGVSTAGFTLAYYANATTTTQDTTASTNSNNTTRQTALNADKSVLVTINGSLSVAGRTVSESSNLRATRLPVMDKFSSM